MVAVKTGLPRRRFDVVIVGAARTPIGTAQPGPRRMYFSAEEAAVLALLKRRVHHKVAKAA